MGKNKFIFDLEWAEVLSDYPPEIRFEVYEAIIGYAASGTLPELKPVANMAFSFIKRQMDYNREKYDDVVEKRSLAGKKSAANRKANSTSVDFAEHTSTNSTSVDFVEQTPTNSTDNDIDNVIDNDKKFVDVDTRDARVRENFKNIFFGEEKIRDGYLKRWETTAEELSEVCEEVLDDWTVVGNAAHGSDEEARQHFIATVRKKYEKIIIERSRKPSGRKKRAAEDSPSGKKVKEGSDLERLDRQQEIRAEAFEKMEKNAVKPADYIRSLGYDPQKVTMVQVLNPDWRAANPPDNPPSTQQN